MADAFYNFGAKAKKRSGPSPKRFGQSPHRFGQSRNRFGARPATSGAVDPRDARTQTKNEG